METTRNNPFAQVLAFIIGTLFIVGLVAAAYIAVQRGMLLAPAQLKIDGQQLRPAAAPLAPRVSVPAPAPAAQPQAPAAPAQAQPQAAPITQPVGQDYQAPAEAVPAGAPMTEGYRETIQNQDRTNTNGEICAPRSGCTKPGDGGALPWPGGRP